MLCNFPEGFTGNLGGLASCLMHNRYTSQQPYLYKLETKPNMNDFSPCHIKDFLKNWKKFAQNYQ